MDITVSKFIAKDQHACPRCIYARIMWDATPNNFFDILIFDNNCTWSGCLSHKHGHRFKDEVEESEECYCRNLRQYLSSRCDMCCYDFLVSSKDPCKATFKWKVKFDECSAVITHGSVYLTLDDPPVCRTVLIDSLMYEQCTIQNCVTGYEQKIAALEASLQTYKEELEKFMHMNNQFEASLYAKFMNLLNSKRKKLEHLQCAVDGIKNSSCVKSATLCSPLPVCCPESSNNCCKKPSNSCCNEPSNSCCNTPSNNCCNKPSNVCCKKSSNTCCTARDSPSL